MIVDRLRFSAIRTGWAILVLLAIVSSGCQTFQNVGPESPDASPLAETTTAAPDAKPPAPRNLPEAICAYLRCVQSCPCERTAAKIDKDAAEKPAQTKSPNADGQNGKARREENRKDAKEKKDDAAKEGTAKDDAEDDANKDDAKENGKDKDDKSDADAKKDEPAWFSGHAQATVVTQAHNDFPSPYVGAHSLLPIEPAATSVTGTLFLAARLWDQGILVFDPEIAGGTGFSGTQGVAGFPNGEITRVGVAAPTPYIARLYCQHTIGFGGEQEKVEDGPNLIAGMRDVDRLTITMGKFTVTDIVDDNRYSHDPRTQFLNWSLMYNGAYDYPANVRGYTFGVAFDRNFKDWAFRYAILAEPSIANGAPLDPHIAKANGNVAEVERRYKLCDRPGKLRVLAYLNNAHMGDYEESIAQMPVDPNITDTRSYRVKYGFGAEFRAGAHGQPRHVRPARLERRPHRVVGVHRDRPHLGARLRDGRRLLVSAVRPRRPGGRAQRPVAGASQLPGGRRPRLHPRRRQAELRARRDSGTVLQLRRDEKHLRDGRLPGDRQPGLQPRSRAGQRHHVASAYRILRMQRMKDEG